MAKQRFRDIKKGRVVEQSNKQTKEKHSTIHASKGLRFKSFVTDSFMLVMPLMYITFYVVFGTREGFAEHKILGWLYILIPLVVIQIIFMTVSGQTPGMRAYNITLIDMATGKKPVFGVIIYRQMLSLLSLPIFGWVLMFMRKDGRTLHELLSRTTLTPTPPKNKS